MEKINITQVNNEISNIKYPLIFLFSLLPYINNIDDENLSIIIRLFLKNHYKIALSANLIKLLIPELKNKNKSKNVLLEFYKIINKKALLISILKRWYLIYDNKKFWKLDLHEQLDYLLLIKNHFMSVYDCSKGGSPYHIKVLQLLNNPKVDRNIILNNIEERLIKILEIFDKKLFKTLDIPLISIYDFYQLNNTDIVKYLFIIYEKFNELLNQTIKLFDSFNLICIQLDNLLNPIIIKIETKIIDSETEIDDINLYCN